MLKVSLIHVLGVIVFDPPRKYAICTSEYDILGRPLRHSLDLKCSLTTDADGCVRERFIQQLNEFSKSNSAREADMKHAVVKNLLSTVIENVEEVISILHDSLDYIDLSLSDDRVIQTHISTWRERLGRWRKESFHHVFLFTSMANALTDSVGESQEAVKISNSAYTNEVAQLNDVQDNIGRLSGRIKSTFEAIMSTMTILESQRAIKQAETVTKLTQLAFLFIPATFIATLFGANIIVCFYPVPHFHIAILVKDLLCQLAKIRSRLKVRIGVQRKASLVDMDPFLYHCHGHILCLLTLEFDIRYVETDTTLATRFETTSS